VSFAPILVERPRLVDSIFLNPSQDRQ